MTNNPDPRTTGILVGSSSYIGVIIRDNRIHDNYYGVDIDGRVRATFSGHHYPPREDPGKFA